MNKMRTKRVVLQKYLLHRSQTYILRSSFFFFITIKCEAFRKMPRTWWFIGTFRYASPSARRQRLLTASYQTKRAPQRKPFSYFTQEILKVLISNGLIVKV